MNKGKTKNKSAAKQSGKKVQSNKNENKENNANPTNQNCLATSNVPEKSNKSTATTAPAKAKQQQQQSARSATKTSKKSSTSCESPSPSSSTGNVKQQQKSTGGGSPKDQLANTSTSVDINTVLVPPPDPLFVLLGAECAISCIQFVSPAMRGGNDLSPAQYDVMESYCGKPDPDSDDNKSSDVDPNINPSTKLLKMPPPGFLHPTTHIAAGMQNGQIIIWDLKTKQQVLNWQAHPHECSVTSIKFISSTKLVSFGRRNSLILWNIKPPSSAATNNTKNSPANKNTAENATKTSKNASPTKNTSGDTKPSTSSSKKNKNNDDGKSKPKCKESSDNNKQSDNDSTTKTTDSSATSNNNKGGSSNSSGLITSYKDDGLFKPGCVPVCEAVLPVGEYLGYAGCDVFKHGKCIVAAMPGSSQDAVRVWSVKDGIPICELLVNESGKVGSVMQLKWIEKKTKVSLLVAYESGNICLWDWTNKDLHSVACIDGGTPMSLEYDQCLGSGVIGATHESFFIFTINNSLQISITREIIMRTEGIGSCISRPDSKLYATGGWDNRIRVFTWQKHRQVAALEYHNDSISCLHYSASKVNTHDKTSDGSDDTGSDHLLAAGSLDGKISLWKIY